MAANEDRAASVILCRKQASTWKTEVSAWRRISEWLFLKLMLLSNYRASCWDQNRFSSWDPMDHSQQAASPRALSHDTSFLASKFCTYTRSSERLCHRHLTVFFSSGTPHMFKAFIATPPQSPMPPLFFLCLKLINYGGKGGNHWFWCPAWCSLWEVHVLSRVRSLLFADRMLP